MKCCDAMQRLIQSVKNKSNSRAKSGRNKITCIADRLDTHKTTRLELQLCAAGAKTTNWRIATNRRAPNERAADRSIRRSSEFIAIQLAISSSATLARRLHSQRQTNSIPVAADVVAPRPNWQNVAGQFFPDNSSPIQVRPAAYSNCPPHWCISQSDRVFTSSSNWRSNWRGRLNEMQNDDRAETI